MKINVNGFSDTINLTFADREVISAHDRLDHHYLVTEYGIIEYKVLQFISNGVERRTIDILQSDIKYRPGKKDLQGILKIVKYHSSVHDDNWGKVSSEPVIFLRSDTSKVTGFFDFIKRIMDILFERYPKHQVEPVLHVLGDDVTISLIAGHLLRVKT